MIRMIKKWINFNENVNTKEDLEKFVKDWIEDVYNNEVTYNIDSESNVIKISIESSDNNQPSKEEWEFSMMDIIDDLRKFGDGRYNGFKKDELSEKGFVIKKDFK